jgi:hypothetical protein
MCNAGCVTAERISVFGKLRRLQLSTYAVRRLSAAGITPDYGLISYYGLEWSFN